MRLLLLNVNTLNYGSMMMAEAFLHHLRDELEGDEQDLEVFVMTSEPEETASRLKEALTSGQVKIHAVCPKDVFRGSKVRQLLSLATGVGIRTLFSSMYIQGSDGVVVLGGDDFTEDYSRLLPLARLLRLSGLTKVGKRVVMLGQTVGPFNSWRESIARNLLREIDYIFAREPITYSYLRHLGLDNVGLSSDLAFLPLAREGEEWSPGVSGSYFTVVPSELLWRYAQDKNRERYIDSLGMLVMEIAMECLPQDTVVILPHVLIPGPLDDRLAGQDLLINLKRRGLDPERIVFIKELLLPFQARRILGKSRIVFTGRMHAAISSLALGVPSLALSYSRKYWGIIGEHLGLKDLIIDVRGLSWEEIQNQGRNKLRLLLDNYDSVRATLLARIPNMQYLALQSIRWVVSLVKRHSIGHELHI